ncbi:hypothetical protein DYB37_003210 [Aphanomyces astaci]|uniref:Calpain catalytic domain-containing protein n=1 Tax=Aphanomyces astaci TaxID=112090 RepID=A0A3R7EYL7_APHAT|nr:hypothetical protein DYB37_003210 [Aphanomyces astaci]RQM21824.1 hypothetical protein B5M09_002834 [Aphanomyces astaci]
MDLEKELNEHGVNVVCSKMDTIISVRIHGATGKRLVETLQLVDNFVASKVAKLAKSCEGKIYFDPCFGPNDADSTGMLALCKNGDVPYAKLHGSYEALIGGYIDVALSDLTGLCSEQIILKPDYAGYGDDPFAPKPGEQAGDGFWKRLLTYKRNGTLMGCSIQPDPKGNKNIVAEGSAGQGNVNLATEPQEEVTDVNQNDGTFFMSFDDWKARYTHFFAGIDFADEWCGLRVEGKWDETSNGGNTTKSTWINNPRYQLLVKERCHLYMSMSQHDPRGSAESGIFPIG